MARPEPDPTEGLPPDLARALRDPSILIPRDSDVWTMIAEAARAHSERDAHLCPWCPDEVRDLFAVAHNVVVNRGNERFAKKLGDLERAVNRYRPALERHFADLRGEEHIPCLPDCRNLTERNTDGI